MSAAGDFMLLSTPITQGEVRIAGKDFDSAQAKAYGPVDCWHHVDCFVQRRSSWNFTDSCNIELISGFAGLKAEDKTELKTKLPYEEPAAKGSGGSEEVGRRGSRRRGRQGRAEVEEKQIGPGRGQAEEFWRIRDQLERNVSKAALIGLLEHNSQGVPSGESNLLDRVADAMLFGALAPCAECKAGQLAYSSAGYKCTGMLSEWAKCLNVTQTPKRVPFKVPAEYHDVDFLKNYKYKPAVRLFPKTAATAQTASSALVSSSGAGSSSSAQPLSGTLFKVVGKHLNPAKKDLESSLKSLGAVLTSTVDAKLTALISSQKDLDSGGKDFDKAKAADVHVVSEAFVAACSKGGVSLMVKAHAISSWGGDVEKRLDRTASRGASDADKLERKFKAQTEKKIKVQVKDGSAVDPDSGVADRAAIVRERGKPLNAMLKPGGPAIPTTSCSAWSRSPGSSATGCSGPGGRIGTTVGGNKLQSFSRRDYAIENFLELFEEKTGNNFFANEFKKLPNRFFPVELDYGQEDDSKLKLSAQKSLKCKLAPQVQQLLQFIFDIDSMKQTMLEFEIDLKKMPLGKISKRQIREAYSVLTDLSNICSAGGSTAQFLEASTRFYSLIPHDFGMRRPPMLDTQEIIKAKLDMLDNLLEIEVAYSMIKSAHGGDGEDPLEAHYKQLHSEIEVLPPDSEDYKRLVEYVENTHAPTHVAFRVKVVNIFKVRREGEEERFKPFKKLPNRKLLWHGSRRTNWAGILSQGLRIAPPEAPATGYMFGKGVYFADMVTKSANYCATTRSEPRAIMLLSEVSLGNMYERTRAEFSTKGVGATMPDPTQTVLDSWTGAEIPLGKPKPAGQAGLSLLYNEYIVYDVSQVCQRYLFQMEFQYR
uniref:Poly [ADP-ribose] polymerase n=1 Tax=Macrostomum lignano TaxID=282301 RepID=A0A1I8IJ16_9PLAT